MIPNPILKVLSTLSCHMVRHLLIGGQACVLYGAAEFSRDCDLVILADDENFRNFQRALDNLQADCIAVPEFKAEYLQRGHAVHFRCQHPDVGGLRIDVMSMLHRFPERIAAIASSRPWLESIGIKDIKHIEYLLRQEEDAQRLADEEYWKPLKAELEQLRLNRHRRK